MSFLINNFSLIIILNTVFFLSLLVLQNIFLSLILSLICLFFLLFAVQHKKISLEKIEIRPPKIALNDRHYVTAIICLILLIFLEYFIGFNAAFLASFLLFSYLNRLDSRSSIYLAIILLFFTALNVNNNQAVAEGVAVFIYYFLVVGIIWRILEILFIYK